MRLIFVLLPLSVLHAQDTHYWTQQFGNRSALMSGAVVGGASDNTMLFYNPGSLAFLKDASVSVNANAYRVEAIRIKNALGNEADFQSDQLGSVPLLAGGMINLQDQRWKLGYGFLAPVDFNFKGIARADGNFNIIDDAESPGAEETVGESSISNKVKELLFAFAASYRLDEHWGFGVSSFFTVRSHTYNRTLSIYSFANDEAVGLVGGNLIQNVDYYNVRYALKVGINYQKEPWGVGLTLTSPSLNLFGKGTTASNIAARNLKLIGDDRVSGVATDRQAKLKTTFKSPFSASFGANYAPGASTYAVTVQYFSGIDIYNIMNPAPGSFVRPVSIAPALGSNQFLQVGAGARSVFNVALGYEYAIDEDFTYYFSGRNDMSYFDEDLNDRSGIQVTTSSWDLYHFASGFTFDKANSSLSLGLLFSTGKNDRYEQSGSINPSLQEGDLLRGAVTITEASYTSLGVLFGFTYYFRKFN
ncbi:hypothetical protein [Robertkochia aurantiaca]|uniref:hypothetical protein n=1 Tax=Robertkochia aurantiaca TaxID=2873700 RepID=UPI001CCEA950|nr:hypothetical protein [Robertkochia sp. 3YJGBD-33]